MSGIVWVLTVCAGITWGGCGAHWQREMPSLEACHEALRTMVVSANGVAATNGNGRQVVAFCAPRDGGR